MLIMLNNSDLLIHLENKLSDAVRLNKVVHFLPGQRPYQFKPLLDTVYRYVSAESYTIVQIVLSMKLYHSLLHIMCYIWEPFPSPSSQYVTTTAIYLVYYSLYTI